MQTSQLATHKIDFRRACRARGLAPRTVTKYLEGITYLIEWCQKQEDQPVTTGLLQDYMADLQERNHIKGYGNRNAIAKPISSSYARNQYTSLQQFFKWAVEEQLITNVWARMTPPKVQPKVVPIIPTEVAKKLLSVCKATTAGEAFYAERDKAMLRFLLDTGVRVDEIATLRLIDVDFDVDLATVQGKGRKLRQVPFGTKTGAQLRKYLRHREKRTFADCPELFIGRKGTLTTQGVREMIERRCREAEVPRIHPHRFRHTFAHTWLAEGLGETDLMRIMGWSSRQMLEVYASSSGAERAVNAHRRAALGDRF